jgi:GntR family transcriptional regulator/MocR family aminotransferase
VSAATGSIATAAAAVVANATGLVSRPGSATRVATSARPAAPAVPTRRTAPRLDVDFVPAVPDLGGFPRDDWAWAVREAPRAAPSAAFGYPDPAGPPRLREVLATYLNRVRGAAWS